VTNTVVVTVLIHSFLHYTRDFPEGQVRTVLISSLYEVLFWSQYSVGVRGTLTIRSQCAVFSANVRSEPAGTSGPSASLTAQAAVREQGSEL